MNQHLINIDIRAVTVPTILHAIDLAKRRGAYTAGETARLDAFHDDVTLAVLADEPPPPLDEPPATQVNTIADALAYALQRVVETDILDMHLTEDPAHDSEEGALGRPRDQQGNTEMLNYEALPNPEYRESFDNYFRRGVPLGGFLTAVMENDLREACARADSSNRHLLFEWVAWLYNEAPARAWGSRENVAAWIKQGGLDGHRSPAADPKAMIARYGADAP